MAGKKHTAEQIVGTLRQIEVSIGNGRATPQACREAGITVQTFYRWRKEFGGLKLDQARRMKGLEKENSRLKRVVVVRKKYVGHKSPSDRRAKRHHRSPSVKQEPNPFSSSH